MISRPIICSSRKKDGAPVTESGKPKQFGNTKETESVRKGRNSDGTRRINEIGGDETPPFIPKSTMLGWLAFFDGLSHPLLLIDFQTGTSFANRALCLIVGEHDPLRSRSSRSSDVPAWVGPDDADVWRQTLAQFPIGPDDEPSHFVITATVAGPRPVRMSVTTQWLWDDDSIAGVVLLFAIHEQTLTLASSNGELTDHEHHEPMVVDLVARLQSALREINLRATAESGQIPHAFSAPTATLSGREREVVYFLAQGKRVQTIAESMGLSESTVRNYIKRIYRKYKVSSEAELRELLGTVILS
jgi:DNA-binding CsgD family transcriptional regulator